MNVGDETLAASGQFQMALDTPPWQTAHMGIWDLGRTGKWGACAAEVLRAVNARHPWSHNDHFRSWILHHLPTQRSEALDVGCGQRELLAGLSSRFDRVLGIDANDRMCESATRRCSGLSNVRVEATPLSRITKQFDLVTMVAVLHHLDLDSTLRQVHRVLRPGGRFLVVGLARPHTLRDHLWDVASAVTNPLIGLVKHPWPSPSDEEEPAFPVADPTLTFNDVRQRVEASMPGAQMRHQLGFRYTIAWQKPSTEPATTS